MFQRKRKRLFIDHQVQTPLVKRLLIYWVAMVAFITLPIAISQTIAQPNRYLFQHYADTLWSHWPILATLSVMLPFVVYDTLKFSNRFAGPVYRMRRELKRFAQGEKISPLRLRPNDFWQDLAVQINDLMKRVRVSEQKAAEVATSAVPQIAVTNNTSSGCDEVAAGV
jgi:hypothetical protein